MQKGEQLETDSFMNALQRLIATCGQVVEIRSDNGTNFLGAERELRQAIKDWNQSQINHMLQQKGIKWIFNPPTGSHHRGKWERLIRSVRKVLNATLRTQTLDEDKPLMKIVFIQFYVKQKQSLKDVPLPRNLLIPIIWKH